MEYSPVLTFALESSNLDGTKPIKGREGGDHNTLPSICFCPFVPLITITAWRYFQLSF